MDTCKWHLGKTKPFCGNLQPKRICRPVMWGVPSTNIIFIHVQESCDVTFLASVILQPCTKVGTWMALTRSQDPWLLPVLRELSAKSSTADLGTQNQTLTSQATPTKQTPHALRVGHIRPNPGAASSDSNRDGLNWLNAHQNSALASPPGQSACPSSLQLDAWGAKLQRSWRTAEARHAHAHLGTQSHRGQAAQPGEERLNRMTSEYSTR